MTVSLIFDSHTHFSMKPVLLYNRTRSTLGNESPSTVMIPPRNNTNQACDIEILKEFEQKVSEILTNKDRKGNCETQMDRYERREIDYKNLKWGNWNILTQLGEPFEGY